MLSYMKTTCMIQGLFFLCLLLVSGCITTTSTRIKKGDSGKRGVDVIVHQDGTLKLYGNPIEKTTLVKRLIKEESAHKGRAIVLQAKGNVHRSDLIALREYLVANRIPNVVVVMPVTAYSFQENTQDAEIPETAPVQPSTSNRRFKDTK